MTLIDIPCGLTTAERVEWTSARLADLGPALAARSLRSSDRQNVVYAAAMIVSIGVPALISIEAILAVHIGGDERFTRRACRLERQA
jgi:hypothetical protein